MQRIGRRPKRKESRGMMPAITLMSVLSCMFHTIINCPKGIPGNPSSLRVNCAKPEGLFADTRTCSSFDGIIKFASSIVQGTHRTHTK